MAQNIVSGKVLEKTNAKPIKGITIIVTNQLDTTKTTVDKKDFIS